MVPNPYDFWTSTISTLCKNQKSILNLQLSFIVRNNKRQYIFAQTCRHTRTCTKKLNKNASKLKLTRKSIIHFKTFSISVHLWCRIETTKTKICVSLLKFSKKRMRSLIIGIHESKKLPKFGFKLKSYYFWKR